MSDLVPVHAINTILNWFLWAAIALGAGLVIVSLALMAVGRRDNRLLLSGLAAIALGLTLNQIYAAVMEGISLEEPYQFITAVITATLLIMAVLYFAVGKPERGGKALLAAILTAGFFALIPALQGIFSVSAEELTGSCIILMEDLKTDSLEVTGKVKMSYGAGSYSLLIDYGDGTTETGSITAGSTYSFKHTYQESGSYVISATASNGEHTCSVVSPVTVDPLVPWTAPNTETPGALLGLSMIPLTYYYIVPEFDLKEGSFDWKVYSTTAAIAFSALALIISLRLVSGFLSREPEESMPETLKDTVIILAIILIAPYLYQVFAILCNRLSAIPLQNIDITAFFAAAAGLIGLSMALGFFSSFFGFLGSFLAVSLIMSNLTALVRVFMIKALILIFPFIGLLYLFHVTRSAAQTLMSLMIGLAVAGPVAAFVLAGLASNAGILAGLIAPVFAYVLFPYLLSLAQGASPLSVAQGIMRLGSQGVAGMAGSISRGGQSPGGQNPAGGSMPGGAGGNPGGATGGSSSGGRVIVAPPGGSTGGGTVGPAGGTASTPSQTPGPSTAPAPSTSPSQPPAPSQTITPSQSTAPSQTPAPSTAPGPSTAPAPSTSPSQPPAPSQTSGPSTAQSQTTGGRTYQAPGRFQIFIQGARKGLRYGLSAWGIKVERSEEDLFRGLRRP